MVRFEAQKLLQKGQAQDFPIVHLGRGARAGNQLPIVAHNPRLRERIVERGINRNDDILEIERWLPVRHGLSLPKKSCCHTGDIGRLQSIFSLFKHLRLLQLEQGINGLLRPMSSSGDDNEL